MAKTGLMAKRIPTLIGVLILLGGLVAGVILVNNRQGFLTKAGPTESPKNVKITNNGADTFTVSWTTDTPVTGFIKYSENPAKITSPAGDIRDQISGSSQSYTNHYVTVTGLNPATTNYFLIGSGSQMYDDSGKPFQVRTGPTVIAPPEDVISGKVVGADGNPVNNAIVYVETEGGQTLSAMTKVDGTWRLNLALSRDSTGAVLTYDTAAAVLSIFVQAGISGSATAITNTGLAKPVPDIVLGKNQNFVTATEASGSGTLDAGTVKSEGFGNIAQEAAPVAAPEATETGSLTVSYPALNGEMIATSSPEFRGNTAPGTTIRITVQSSVELTQMIKADKNGLWQWTPPQSLDPGVHTLTLEYTDTNNIFQRIVRTFTVLAAGDLGGLPAFVSTPSGSITPTITVTPTPTLSGRPSVTPLITPSVASTRAANMPATTSSNLESTGSLGITILMGSLGVVLLLFGRVSKRWWRD